MTIDRFLERARGLEKRLAADQIVSDDIKDLASCVRVLAEAMKDTGEALGETQEALISVQDAVVDLRKRPTQNVVINH